MKKILFPTDFSLAAENALQYAIALAKDIDASIDLIHVYSIPFNDASALPADYIESMLKETKASIKKQLDDIVKRNPDAPIENQKAIYGLFVATEIIELAYKNDCDLIVMGTKGANNLLEKIIGSITSHTMLRAHCPVIAIPEKATYSGIEAIAFATALDKKDVPVIAKLVEWTNDLSAQLNFVHIDTKSGTGIIDEIKQIENFPIPFSDFTIINDPSVVHGLDSYIEDQKIDILAMYIPHRRLWERIFHRSISKKMALHTHIPLLTFKDHQ